MKKLLRLLVTHGGIFVIALFVANVSNFIYNAYLGRMLLLEDYGIITLLNTFWYILTIILIGLASTVTHEVAFHAAQNEHAQSNAFTLFIRQRSFRVSLIGMVLWLLFSPMIAAFFQTETLWPVLTFAPMIYFGAMGFINRAYLLGNLLFVAAAATVVFEAVSKLVLAVGFVITRTAQYTYLSIPLSIIASFVLSAYLAKHIVASQNTVAKQTFPKAFFSAAVLAAGASMIFLTLDILLVKHFVSPKEAGIYALLALIGKMIYFIGTLANTSMFTLVSRSMGAATLTNRDAVRTFMVSSIAIVILAALLLGPLGYLVVPILLGSKGVLIIEYLPLYCTAIALYTIASQIVTYHLAKRHLIFPVASISLSLTLLVTLNLMHSSIAAITHAMFLSAVLTCIGILGLHYFHEKLQFAEVKLARFWPRRVYAN